MITQKSVWLIINVPARSIAIVAKQKMIADPYLMMWNCAIFIVSCKNNLKVIWLLKPMYMSMYLHNKLFMICLSENLRRGALAEGDILQAERIKPKWMITNVTRPALWCLVWILTLNCNIWQHTFSLLCLLSISSSNKGTKEVWQVCQDLCHVCT